MNADSKACLSFAGIAAALLLSGVMFYVAVRTALPAPLERLQVKPLAMAGSFESNVFIDTVPSLIHVTAFSLLTGAFLRPRVRSILVAGAIWAGIGLIWELSCAGDQAWLRVSGVLIGVDWVPMCTYDAGDIAASIAGAAAATCVAWLVLKSHSVQSSPAQERLP